MKEIKVYVVPKPPDQFDLLRQIQREGFREICKLSHVLLDIGDISLVRQLMWKYGILFPMEDETWDLD